MKNIKDIMDEMSELAVALDPCDVDCTPTLSSFCCLISVPSGFTFDPAIAENIIVGYVKKCCTVVLGDPCCQEVCGCFITLQKYSVNACIDINVAIKATEDTNLDNIIYLCCSDVVCFDGNGVACLAPEPDDGCENVTFNISEVMATEVPDICDKIVYKITGTIGLGCSNCELLPTPAP